MTSLKKYFASMLSQIWNVMEYLEGFCFNVLMLISESLLGKLHFEHSEDIRITYNS